MSYAYNSICLVGSTGDEEPLVNAGVDWCSREVLVGRDGRKLVGLDAVGAGALNGQIGAADVAGLGLAGDELLPGLGALADDVGGVPEGFQLAWFLTCKNETS